MAWVVMRRFRTSGETASSKSFKRERDALAAAETWADEGWDVTVVAAGERTGSKHLRRPDEDGPGQDGKEPPAG